MSQKLNIRERRYNGVDYDIMHPETDINMILDSSNNSVGDVNGALYGDGNGNIVGATISNLNLLDNSWFTINQRGVTSATIVNNTYYLDRWFATYATNAGTIEVVSTGIKLTPATNAYVYIKQKKELFASLNGKTITASILLSDGTIEHGTITRTTGTTQEFFDSANFRIRFVSDETFEVRTGVATTIRAVKLEPGSVSTLGNDVAPDYTTELLKCQRYFRRYSCIANASPLCFGYTTSATNIRAILPISVPMVGVPAISYVGSIRANANGDKGVSAITLDQLTPQGASLNLAITGGTQYSMAYVYLETSSSYIDLSADLH